MNSTGGPAGSRGLIRWPLTRRWVFAALSGLALARALAQANPIPRPPLLERDVQFWIRVYTQIDTNAGLLHDQYNLSVVYDTLHFAPNTTPAEREHQVDQAREHYGGALRRIADAADAPPSAEDQRIKELWGAEGTPARLRSAIEGIRLPPGPAGRFRARLIPSRARETLGTDDIARIVRSYSSRTFGFASRNFYVSFLAALDIDRNPEKYFGALQKQSEARFQEVQMPAYVPMATLERALKIDADKLRALNPALLRSVWAGQQRVPKP